MVSDERLAAYLETLHAAAEVPLDTSRPIRFYVRSADSVFKQACIYKSEGDLEKAFILFLKYSNLVLKDLPKHPEYRNSGALVAPLRGNVLNVLDLLEQTKPILLERFKEAEAEQQRLIQREQEAVEARRRDDAAKELALQAARSQEEARKQRILEMQKLDMAKAYQKNMERPVSLSPLGPASSSSLESVAKIPPLVPTTRSPMPSTKADPLAMPHDQKIEPPPSLSVAAPRAQFCLENGLPLRLVNVPQTIIGKFLEMATANTRQNLETCGVLAGTLSHDVFTITTLLIPKQTSTSDTVAMLNEEEIFEVQDHHGLLTLGWIHTHPTQQCFMSSVDLHTHFPYQLLVAEAIAIVVAPTQSPNYGIFRLTDPPGIGVISKCPQRGFHPHPSERAIYREISGSEGHAKMVSSLPLEIIDLRNKP